MDTASPFRLVTSQRGPPGRPFGWEICKGDAAVEVARSSETFRSRHEAITDGERTPFRSPAWLRPRNVMTPKVKALGATGLPREREAGSHDPTSYL